DPARPQGRRAPEPCGERARVEHEPAVLAQEREELDGGADRHARDPRPADARDVFGVPDTRDAEHEERGISGEGAEPDHARALPREEGEAKTRRDDRGRDPEQDAALLHLARHSEHPHPAHDETECDRELAPGEQQAASREPGHIARDTGRLAHEQRLGTADAHELEEHEHREPELDRAHPARCQRAAQIEQRRQGDDPRGRLAGDEPCGVPQHPAGGRRDGRPGDRSRGVIERALVCHASVVAVYNGPARFRHRGRATPDRAMEATHSVQSVVIVGAGPAGLTAAYELGRQSVPVVVLEQGSRVGGLARTEEHGGFRFDLGGRRFFTKVREVSAMWREVLGGEFLRRPRLSRIYYNGRFVQYPLKPFNALRALGTGEAVLVVLSYLRWQVRPHRREDTFEQWVTNRFGERLFRIFFKTYTEKVWGISCSELKAEWAAQRIRNLSLRSAVFAMLVQPRTTITTLIEEFDYPRLGPGMMWGAVRDAVERRGGTVELESEVVGVQRDGDRITSVVVARDGARRTIAGTHFISSMPVTALVARLDPPAPPDVREAASALHYRDFLTVCLIVDDPDLFPDNWIYVHDPGVRVGRIQ